MNPRVQVALILILTVLLDAVAVLQAAEAQGTGFLSGWQYRKSHVINPASGAGTGYQIRIKVHYGSGTDGGENVYLNGKCRSDFGDIRFTRSDGVTLLDCWMESKEDGNYAIFWVKIADDLSSDPVTIYVYYGNPSATYPYLSSSTAHGEATFEFFDDFNNDLSKWTIVSGTWRIENGELSGETSGFGQRIRANGFTFLNHAVHVKIKWVSGTYFEHAPFVRGQAPNEPDNGYCAHLSTWSSVNRFRICKRENSTNYYLATYGTVNPSQGVWYQCVFKLYNNILRASFSPLYPEEIAGTDSTFSSGSLCLFGWSNTAEHAHYDDLFVRKYVYPEPEHGTWGSEETPLRIALSVAPNITSNSLTYVNVTACKAGAISLVNASIRVGDVIRLLWSNGSGFSKLADPYDYCRLVAGSCSVQALNSTAVKVTFALVLSGRMPLGQLSITATAVDASNMAAEASTQVSFTPLKPTPASPANGSGPVAPGEALTFSWTLPQGVTQTAFELQIDDSPLFSSPLLDTGKVPSGSTSHSYAVPKAGRWYWRVKVWDSFDVDTGWSSVYVVMVGFTVSFYGPFWDNGTRCAEPATVTVYMGDEYEPIVFTLSNDTLLLTDARPIFASYSFSGGVNRVLYLTSPESVFFVSRPRSEYMAVYTVQLVDYAGVLTSGVFFQVATFFPEAGGFETIISTPASYSVDVILEYGCLYMFRLVKPGSWTIDLQAVTPGVGGEIRVPVRLYIGDEAAATYKYVTVDVDRTGASVIVAYRDQLEANSTAVIEIVNYYTGVLVWSEERHGAVWQLIYPYADPDAAYRVTVTVNHPRLGQLRFVKAVPGRPLEANPFSVGLDAALGEIPLPGGGRLPLSQAVTAFLILVFAGLFSTRNAYYGAAATVAFAFLLYYLGWFRADLAVLTVCLGLAVTFLITEKYRRELT